MESGAQLGDVAASQLEITRQKLCGGGGFFAALEEGEAILIPPGFMITEASSGMFPNTSEFFEKGAGIISTTVAARLRPIKDAVSRPRDKAGHNNWGTSHSLVSSPGPYDGSSSCCVPPACYLVAARHAWAHNTYCSFSFVSGFKMAPKEAQGT